VETVGDQYQWLVQNVADDSYVTTWSFVDCSNPFGFIQASVCNDVTPPTNSCSFTITNNTNCSLNLLWNDGMSTYTGTTIPPNGSVVESIGDQYQWSTSNSSDGSTVTSWAYASCSSPSGIIPASACTTVTPSNSCAYTITNYTDCDLQLHWFDGANYIVGAIVSGNSSVVETVLNQSQWMSVATATGAYVTSWSFIDCSNPYGSISASACQPSIQVDIGDCQNEYINGIIFSDEEIAAPSFVVSPSIGSSCTILGNAISVSYEAGDYIELGIGFEVEQGSKFSAEIGGCD